MAESRGNRKCQVNGSGAPRSIIISLTSDNDVYGNKSFVLLG